MIITTVLYALNKTVGLIIDRKSFANLEIQIRSDLINQVTREETRAQADNTRSIVIAGIRAQVEEVWKLIETIKNVQNVCG